MLLCRKPPSSGRNQTLGCHVVAVCNGAGWRHVNHQGAVAIRMSGKGRGTWHWGAVFVMRGTLPGMFFYVFHECVRFVKRSACLVVGLGANMIGGASEIHASSCGGMLFVGSASSSVTLCLGTLCLDTPCSLGGTYGTLCRSPCGRIHLCPGCVRLYLGSLSCPAANFSATRVSTQLRLFGGISCIVVTSLSITSCRCLFHIQKGTWQCCGNNFAKLEIQ